MEPCSCASCHICLASCFAQLSPYELPLNPGNMWREACQARWIALSSDLNPTDGVLQALRVMPEVAHFHGFASRQLHVAKPAYPLQVVCLGDSGAGF